MKKETFEPKNVQTAIEHAIVANESAFIARFARKRRDELELILKAWTALFSNSSIPTYLILFLLAIVVEVNFSFAMYEDIAQGAGEYSTVMAYFAAFFIVYLGALVSHYIAKMLSKSMFEYAVINIIKANDHDIPYIAAKEQAIALKKKDFAIGLVLAAVVITVVYMVSFQRLTLLGVIYHRKYDLIHRYLPVFAVIVEMFAGIYLGYIWKRLYSQIKLQTFRRRFRSARKNCIEHTKLAVHYYNHAMAHNEEPCQSKDLMDAISRWEDRSVDSDDYIDHVAGVKTLSVKVMDGTLPASNVHLTGLLLNNGNCTSIYTNEAGVGILTWVDDVDEVILITADDDIFKGPWRANSHITIHLRKLRRIKAA